MNKAKQFNRCAQQVKIEQKKILEKNTYQWIEEVLMPYLQKMAEKGYFSSNLHKLYNFATNTWCFESIEHPKGGLNIEIITQELEKAGFYVENGVCGKLGATIYHISWEDKYVY